jgi:hypothetical protein
VDKSKGAHRREVEARSKDQRVLSDEVRDFPLPLLRGGKGPHHAEMARRRRMRDHCGAATEGLRRSITSAPTSPTTRVVVPPEKAHPQLTTAAATTII